MLWLKPLKGEKPCSPDSSRLEKAVGRVLTWLKLVNGCIALAGNIAGVPYFKVVQTLFAEIIKVLLMRD